jgi:hypothetical protein
MSGEYYHPTVLTFCQVFELPNLDKPVFFAPNLSALPPVLSTEDRQRRAAARETLTEILVADLGDDFHSTPHLIVRISIDSISAQVSNIASFDHPWTT